MRYTGVEGAAYLEMWSFFADGSSYFSRTLADEGPLASVTGDSDGRDFVLPFTLNGSPAPVRIEFSVVLPGEGTVWVGPLSLEGFGVSAAWWSEQTSAIIGASLGVAIGLVAAITGLLSGRRRARKTVTRLLAGGVIFGVVSLLAGGVALLVLSQPRHIWYPLALIGVILVVVDGAVLAATRRAQQADEFTRIKAMDTLA
ncbi:MAG: hypothetical protein U9N56_11830 [Actinomycetota bacterium]|nr:hypothetical protein [Actinomycetota bacterium]